MKPSALERSSRSSPRSRATAPGHLCDEMLSVVEHFRTRTTTRCLMRYAPTRWPEPLKSRSLGASTRDGASRARGRRSVRAGALVRSTTSAIGNPARPTPFATVCSAPRGAARRGIRSGHLDSVHRAARLWEASRQCFGLILGQVFEVTCHGHLPCCDAAAAEKHLTRARHHLKLKFLFISQLAHTQVSPPRVTKHCPLSAKARRNLQNRLRRLRHRRGAERRIGGRVNTAPGCNAPGTCS